MKYFKIDKKRTPNLGFQDGRSIDVKIMLHSKVVEQNDKKHFLAVSNYPNPFNEFTHNLYYLDLCLFIRCSSLSSRSHILSMELLSCDSWLESLSLEVIVLIVWGGFVVDSLTTDAQERLFSEVLL